MAMETVKRDDLRLLIDAASERAYYLRTEALGYERQDRRDYATVLRDRADRIDAAARRIQAEEEDE